MQDYKTDSRIRLHSWLLLGGVLCLCLGFAGCGAASSGSSQTSTIRTVDLDASWTILYSDAKSAKSAADVVVLGTITSIRYVGPVQNDDGKDDGLIFTDYQFHIDKVVVDTHQLLTNVPITIHQTGGMLKGTTYEIHDDPLFQVNEQSLLFLHFYQPGKAYVIGGPSGRYSVQNGIVQPRVPGNGLVTILSHAISVDDFIKQIQDA